MAEPPINILLSSFPGLPLPSTLCLSFPFSATVSDVTERIASYLPGSLSHATEGLILTTNNNSRLFPRSPQRLSLILDREINTSKVDNVASYLLPLRLTVPLRGGKGGFGSQLRAAGGRMSSKRKRNQREDNGSSRNLDGRRLRTINEAKALAEYLAVKPEMDRKEKEERRRRWEAVVEMAERRQEELRSGGGKNRLEGQWMEDKDEMSEKAREAVLQAMKDNTWHDSLKDSIMGGSSTSASEGDSSRGSPSDNEISDEDDQDDVNVSGSSDSSTTKSTAPRRFIGFDEDDEFMSSDEEDDGKTNGSIDESDEKGKRRT